MLAVCAALQNSVQAQKHTAPSGLQLRFRDVRVLNIQSYLRVIQWVSTITKVHALYMYVCMYMVYTYQTAPIHVLYTTTHYVLFCVIQTSIESFHINMAVTSGGCCGLGEDRTLSLQPAVTFITGEGGQYRCSVYIFRSHDLVNNSITCWLVWDNVHGIVCLIIPYSVDIGRLNGLITD